MTMSGTWMAKSSTKSHSPRSAISSMIWLDSSRMWSASWRTIRGVKPLLTSRRWRVCSGSSIEMIDIGAATLGRTPWAAEYSSWWRLMWLTSSWRDTTHISLRASHHSGALVRSQRYASHGSS